MKILYNNKILKDILICTFLFTLVLLCIYLNTACAADALPGNNLNNVVSKFKESVSSFGVNLQGYARKLFFILLGISFVWKMGMQFVQGQVELNSIFASLFQFTFIGGFFLWLINSSNDLLFNAMKEFSNFATAVGGSKDASPSSMISYAYQYAVDLAKIAFGSTNGGGWEGLKQFFTGGAASIFLSILGIILMLFVAGFVGCIFVITGFNMMMVNLTLYFTMYVGIFVMGFAGSSVTRDIAINYLKGVVATAVTYFGMIIAASVCFKFLNSMVSDLVTSMNNAQPEDQISAGLSLLIASYAMYLIISKMPPLIGALIGGGTWQAGLKDVGVGSGAALNMATKTGIAAAGLGVASMALAGGAVKGAKNNGLGATAMGGMKGLAGMVVNGMSGGNAGKAYNFMKSAGATARSMYGGSGGGSGNLQDQAQDLASK